MPLPSCSLYGSTVEARYRLDLVDNLQQQQAIIHNISKKHPSFTRAGGHCRNYSDALTGKDEKLTDTATAMSPRVTCQACHRPVRVCICHALPSEVHRLSIDVLVLQHPAEAKAAIKTGDVLPLCLHKVSIVVTQISSNSELLKKALEVGGAYLLWPGEGAMKVDEVKNSTKTIVALDGTWKSTKRMIDKNPLLQRMQKIRLDGVTGRFRIRRPPSFVCSAVSTAEAVGLALGELGESQEAVKTVLDVVCAISDAQIKCMREERAVARHRREKRGYVDDLYRLSTEM